MSDLLQANRYHDFLDHMNIEQRQQIKCVVVSTKAVALERNEMLANYKRYSSILD